MAKNNPFEKYLGPEDHLHLQVVQYVQWQYPGAKVMHAPNEGKRSEFERFKISRLGVSSGFPDLFIVYNKKVIAVELKVKGNKPTANQIAWVNILNFCGIPAVVATGWDEAKAFIDKNLKGTV